MCEINPAHRKTFKLEFFTSDYRLTEDQWLRLVMEKALEVEQSLNFRGDIRAHVHELEISEHCINNGCHLNE